MKRNQAEERVKALGGTAKTTVVKDLTYLVTNDPESGSSKNKKAMELGVKIIDEEAFLTLLGTPTNGGEKAPSGGNRKPRQQELF